MKIIDLTYSIDEDIPVYPGMGQPVFNTRFSIEKNSFFEREISFYSHTGTHIDAPAHIIKNAKTLDEFEIGQFYGKAFLLKRKIKSSTVELSELLEIENKLDFIDFLIIKTDWDKYWGDERYFSGFPTLSLKSAQWLGKFNLKGIGFDTVSADKSDAEDFIIHKELLGNNCLIIENLTNLDKIIPTKFIFSAMPLKLEGADGSPVRAFAIL